MNTQETLFTKNKIKGTVTHMCETVINKQWDKGAVAGIYRNCFNILTDCNYMLTVFKDVSCYSTRAMITDIRADMSALPIRNGSRVSNCDGVIYAGDLVLDTKGAELIRVKREPSPAAGDLKENIDYLRSIVVGYEKERPAIYDAYLQKKAKAGFDALKKNAQEGFEKLIGLGIGLTPSCDDIVAGMSAYFYLMGMGDNFNRELKKYLNSKGDAVTTMVSKNLLEDVANGYINPALYNLVYAVMHNKEDIAIFTPELISYGSTSGTETCVGILYAYELTHGKEQIEWL